jgi:hypothetical protein
MKEQREKILKVELEKETWRVKMETKNQEKVVNSVRLKKKTQTNQLVKMVMERKLTKAMMMT